MPFLQTRQGGRWRRFELNQKLTSIGRADDNDFAIDDPRLSEYHAQIALDGDSFLVQPFAKGVDLRVNGRRVKKEHLYHNDVLSLNGIEIFFSLYELPSETEPREKSEIRAYRQLYEFSARLAGEFDITKILEQFLDALIDITKAGKGFVILFDGETPVVKAARNVDKLNITGASGQISDSIISKVIKTQKPLIVSDALHDAEFNAAESVLSLRLASVLCVPLMIRKNLFGVLYLGNDNIVNLFEPGVLEILTIFTAQAALLLQNAMLVNELRLESEELASRLTRYQAGDIIGSCEGIREVMKKVRKVATTDISVLILGETGTGKELIAQAVHRASNRAKGPFVVINCGAIPETLLESELFGYVKGAFTGASATRGGKFQAANGGTIFLDEIGEMPLQLQVKLLRVLAEKTVVKVGDSRPEAINIRVVAATNRNLKEEVKEGRFREDLFYRLNTVALTLPPLRERGEDIIVIAKYFLQKYAAEYGSRTYSFTPTAVASMRRASWPGNIRELENRVKKAVILTERAMIGPEDMELSAEDDLPILSLAQARDEWQRSYVYQVLQRNGGNRTKTAHDLGVDPRTIFRFLEKESGEEGI